MGARRTDPNPRCSIVVPAFNRPAITVRCLEALLGGREEASFEVIVVDDGSDAETGKALSPFADRVRILRHELNEGFARTCNDGARLAEGEFLVFLNNDTEPRPGWLGALVRHADEHPEAAVVGSKLLFPDGTVQHAGVAICQDGLPRHVYAGFPADHPAVCRSRPFQSVTFAAALVRRQAFADAGGFDVGFANGYEDVDLCLRLGELGHQVRYCHESVLTHLESVTRRHETDEFGVARYLERWAGRVVPDDLGIYLEDGLATIQYDALYPFRVVLAPELALVRGRGTSPAIEELLDRRAAERQRLLKENIRLAVELAEALRARETRAGSARPKRSTGAASVSRHEPLPLAGYSGERIVTVAVLASAADSTLDEQLARVRGQRAACAVELLVLDGGADQGRNRGAARNAAAALAEGEICVLLEGGALPADEGWLSGLLAAFAEDDRLAAARSRILPEPAAGPSRRLELESDPCGSPEPATRDPVDEVELARLDLDELRRLLEFRSPSTAVRTSVAREIPFPEGASPADLGWTRSVLLAGYRLRHEPRSRVVRESEEAPLEALLRSLALGAEERDVLARAVPASSVVPQVLTLVRHDWEALAALDLAPEQLEEQQILAALRRALEGAGSWLGSSSRAGYELPKPQP